MADVTTMKISTATRDRLRSMGADGQSLEEILVEALDIVEAQCFWSQAEHAAQAETSDQRAARLALERDTDRWMDALS